MADPDILGFVQLANRNYTGAVDRAREQALFGAQQAAGRAYAGGDATGAGQILARAGDIPGAQQLTQFGNQQTQFGQQQADRQRNLDIIAAKQREATSYANRDYAGAATAAAAQGDPQAVLSAQDKALQVHQAQQQYLARAMPVLNAARQKGQLSQAFQTLAPDLKALGATDDDIQKYVTSAQTDPDGTLGAINSTVQKKWTYQKVGEDLYAVNEANPDDHHIVARGNIVKKADETVFTPDDGSASVGAGGSAATAGGGAGASMARGSAPLVGYSGPGATRGDRNNNPFNVKTPPQGMWQGQVGTDDEGHAIFDSPANGMRAGDLNLQAYARHGITTPDAFINRYIGRDASPATRSNYIAAITQAVGPQFDLSNPSTRQAIAPAVLHMEGTHMPTGGGAPPAPVAQTVGVQAPPGYRVLGGGGMRYRPATAQELQGTGYASGLYDTATGDIKHGIKPGESDAPLADIPTATGDALLKQLSPGEANLVKMYVEGKMPIPTGAAMRSPQTQRLMQLASQYDPTFDAVNYAARASTRKDFSSGKAAQNLTSFNTAIGHLGELDSAIDKLGNQNGIEGISNPARAFFQQNVMHNPAYDNFNAARSAVASELVRAFRGTGGSLSEVQDFEHQLDGAKSPQQLHQVVQTMTHLLASRIDSLTQQYNTGMGTTADAPPGLTPKAKTTLNKLAGTQLYSTSGQAVPQLRSAPSGVKILSVSP